MKVRLIVALACAVAFSAAAGELEVAREALRDGLWAVARTHAERAGGDEGRFVILESYAREERWDELLTQLDAWDEGIGGCYWSYRVDDPKRSDWDLRTCVAKGWLDMRHGKDEGEAPHDPLAALVGLL